VIIILHCSIHLFPFNFKYSPLLSYVWAISGHKDLKFQAPESSINVNGAIGLGEKEKEERKGKGEGREGTALGAQSPQHTGAHRQRHITNESGTHRLFLLI
jgi:hypothetical protein